ncbi:MAG: transglycosylase SLT domain-containing protein [bacterium]|nr:transglycosylase SLT domain-containing protein [bacterium]
MAKSFSLILFLFLIVSTEIYGMAKPKMYNDENIKDKDSVVVSIDTLERVQIDTLPTFDLLEDKLLDSTEFCVLAAEYFFNVNDQESSSYFILPAFEFYYKATFDSTPWLNWNRAQQLYSRIEAIHFNLRRNGIFYSTQRAFDWNILEKQFLTHLKNDTLLKHSLKLLKRCTIDTIKHKIKLKNIYQTLEDCKNKQPIKPQLQSIPLVYNDRVQSKINYFKNNEKGRRQFEIYLSRIVHMDPRIIPILKEEGIPEEIICLAIVESALKHDAVSRAKATGVFQFMRETALKYGLQVNEWYDERYNVEKSTRAASSYLRKLYEEDFQDWHLAMAAYNAGEGRIKRSINNQTGVSYWKLKRGRGVFRIPKETYNYVPTILAIIDLYKNLEVYGFQKPILVKRVELEEVVINGLVGFDILSQIVGLTFEDFVKLNPEYVNFMTDPTNEFNSIKVPLGMGKMVLNRLKQMKPEEKIFWVNYTTSKHPIKLKEIAEKFQLRDESIKQLGNNRNSISRNRVIPQKSLYFPVLLSVARRNNLFEDNAIIKVNEADSIKTGFIVDKREEKYSQNAKFDLNPEKNILNKEQENKPSFIYVKKGDSLIKISKKYDVPLEKILEWNNKQRNQKIYPNEKIYITDPTP